MKLAVFVLALGIRVAATGLDSKRADATVSVFADMAALAKKTNVNETKGETQLHHSHQEEVAAIHAAAKKNIEAPTKTEHQRHKKTSVKAAKAETKLIKKHDKDAKQKGDDDAKEDKKNTSESVPFSDLEPFGREERAQELTEASIKQSNKMVDQIEKAEVAETKRSVFRALTRLRGAAVASFDGVANSQVSNIDGYAKKHQYRDQHDIRHLADEEDDVESWAFPSNADFL